MNSNQNERNVLLTASDSAKRATRRPWRTTWIGIVGSILLLGIVILIDRPTEEGLITEQARMTELIGPSDLELDGEQIASNMVDPSMGLDMPRGGWIQVADQNGQLSQQYRCEHLDPDPKELDAHWISMDRPEVELYMSQNRLVTLTGDTALAYAPQRELEEGQFNGNVRIAMYDPVDGRPANPLIDSPALVIRTPRATFDNFLGKISCDGRIELDTPREEMVGRDLQVLLNDQDQRIEYLKMAKLDYLLIRSPEKTRLTRSGRRSLKARWQPDATSLADQNDSPVTFYQLTLSDNVRIQQGQGARARTALGDKMNVVFSLKSEQFATPATAMSSPPATFIGSRPLSLPAIGASMAIGTPSLEMGNEILVTCDGPVTMIPLLETEDHLADPRDAKLQLLGGPVLIEDPQRRLRITCPTVEYTTLAQRFDLLGDDATDVDLLTDRFRAEGSWMWASPESGEAGFINPGTIEVMSGASPLARVMDMEIDGQQAPIGTAMDAMIDGTPDTSVQLELTWQGGVDIEFEPDGPGTDEPEGDPALKSILFRDQVAVQSEDGTIDCGSLKMNFMRGPDGGSEPERMVALENVRARNDDQTLWTDQLIVTMEAGETAAAITEPAKEDLFGGNVNIKDFLATGDVQVLLADGGRAFADRLEGDARQEIAVLTGRDVTVARKEMLINHGQKLVISRMTGTANWDGPGQARMLRYPLDVSADERIERPQVPTTAPKAEDQKEAALGSGPVTMRARWNEAMSYDSRHNEGAGSIELRGKVAVVSDGSPTERSTMDGDSLTLQFAFSEENGTISRRTTTDPLDINAVERESRVLETMIARGNARLERREWILPARSDLPSVFFIAAKHITWNDLDVTAEVIGDGSLVIREPATEDAADSIPEGPFSGPGTSRFVWTKRLDLERMPGDRYELSMLGNVEGLYRGLTDDDVATITANQVEAVTRRSRGARTRDQANPLDFQGDMEIEQLHAQGEVYLATPQRRADAHDVDYDTRTQIATLTARPGRKVSIITEGSPLPVKATKMVWNMDPLVDSIQLLEPSGSGAR
ncbi:MAG: hypothetical protein P8J89_00300 [Phycisphaerales bacterium]|nr:hypothetical protein [Phycisphaerales bacterium]